MSVLRACALLLAIALGGCGGGAAAAPAAGPHVGVQSNSAASAVTLRVAARAPLTFGTELRISLVSEFLSTPVSAELETRGVRRVGASRPDGSVEVEEI